MPVFKHSQHIVNAQFTLVVAQRVKGRCDRSAEGQKIQGLL